MPASTATGREWSSWRTIVGFGLVSLAADMLYEGMRAIAGPFLGSLGASALVVGVVTGAGEGIALVLRLVTGSWADRAQRHWRLTVVGYAMTAVCVPLLAVAPFLGAAGLGVAVALILLERVGKAVRSPAKSALLARVARPTGRGRGFGVHKALDQVGAFSGPLLLAGMAAWTGLQWPGLALLAVPGAICLVLLALLRRHAPVLVVPDQELVAAQESEPRARGVRALAASLGAGLPRRFHVFSLATALTTAGLTTFGVISYRFVDVGLVPLAAVPLVYALAMAVGAVASFVTGDLFDRWGGRVLLAVPVLVAAVPALVFGDALGPVLVGVALWGAAIGVQDSTVKAFVADLVPDTRRATAYGVFAAVQGVGALVGGAVAGALVEHHVPWLVGGIAVVQVVAFALTLRSQSPRAGATHAGAR